MFGIGGGTYVYICAHMPVYFTCVEIFEVRICT